LSLSRLFPYPTLFRSVVQDVVEHHRQAHVVAMLGQARGSAAATAASAAAHAHAAAATRATAAGSATPASSAAHAPAASTAPAALDRKSTRLNSSHEWI